MRAGFLGHTQLCEYGVGTIHNSLLKIRFLVSVEQDETVIFNPTVKTLKLGLKIAVSICSTITANRILKKVLETAVIDAKKCILDC